MKKMRLCQTISIHKFGGEWFLVLLDLYRLSFVFQRLQPSLECIDMIYIKNSGDLWKFVSDMRGIL